MSGDTDTLPRLARITERYDMDMRISKLEELVDDMSATIRRQQAIIDGFTGIAGKHHKDGPTSRPILRVLRGGGSSTIIAFSTVNLRRRLRPRMIAGVAGALLLVVMAFIGTHVVLSSPPTAAVTSHHTAKTPGARTGTGHLGSLTANEQTGP